jgi:hypothetical protein
MADKIKAGQPGLNLGHKLLQLLLSLLPFTRTTFFMNAAFAHNGRHGDGIARLMPLCFGDNKPPLRN